MPEEKEENTLIRDDYEEDEKSLYINEAFYDDENDDDIKQKEVIVETLLSGLTEREKDFLVMYYGLGNNKEYTLQEIGDKYGLTRERVRQVIEKLKRKMRCKALSESISFDNF